MRTNPAAPNPFVVGQDSAARFLTVFGECALANRSRRLAGMPMAPGPGL